MFVRHGRAGQNRRSPDGTRDPRGARSRRPAAARSGAPLGRADRAAAAPAAAGGRHLRARQLGPCRDVRQAPDRALHRHSRRRGRAQHRQRLRPAPAPRRPAVPRHLAIREKRRSRRADRERQGGRRADRVDRQCHRRAAGGGKRHRLADGCRTGAQRGREQDVRGDARRAAAPGRGLDRRCRPRWRHRAAAGAAGRRRRARLERSRRGAGRHQQPGHDRPRPHPCHRAGGLAQAQGDLQPACRGVQRRGVSAWAGGVGFVALSGLDVHADRCRRAGHAPARRQPSRQRHRALRRRAGRRAAQDACLPCRPIIPRPTPSV